MELRNEWVHEYLTPLVEAMLKASEAAETEGELCMMHNFASVLDGLKMSEEEKEGE